MKKRMIPAGALLLLLACGQNAPEAAHQREAIVDMDLEPVETPSSYSQEPIPSADSFSGTAENGTFFRYSANMGLASDADVGSVSQGFMDASSTRYRATEKPRPDVGKAISSSAAVQGSDTTHRFIRTADLRFRVEDVVSATLGIEDIVGAHRGWVTSTRLRSEPKGQELIPVSEDSVLEVSRYELVNAIILRVPNTELDSTLRQIGRWVEQFDHRTILADDIRLRLMANAMAVRRARAHSQRVAHAIDDQGRKLKETLAAEEALQASDEKRDQGILNNLDLADRVTYSTVSLSIYQRTLVRKEMIANERNIEGYKPSLWSRIGEALKDGWQLVELAITGLVTIWPIVLLLASALVLLWRNRRKERTSRPAPPQPPSAPVE